MLEADSVEHQLEEALTKWALVAPFLGSFVKVKKVVPRG